MRPIPLLLALLTTSTSVLPHPSRSEADADALLALEKPLHTTVLMAIGAAQRTAAGSSSPSPQSTEQPDKLLDL
ncbi:hypothetical protein H2201_003751 [Coniosporium apollinis]|uniref:Uncharacterized protein n=1 Tax=Coniosporium apollinis TaxID=61459 RepID=A0ABQ9NVV3_9PEZI|nr:hypothetical protein H2201_003751 [Coniosporium apollinis]